MTTGTPAPPKPIGYWLKHLHDLLERHFAAQLDASGLSRRHWQVLHTLAAARRSPAELCEALAPFWPGEDAYAGLVDILDGPAGLVPRGWAAPDPHTGMLGLTPHGAVAHAEISARVEQARATVLTGLTPEQYEETVRVLRVMAANVEAAL